MVRYDTNDKVVLLNHIGLITFDMDHWIYDVFQSKENLKSFYDEKVDVFFVVCKPEESELGFPFALVEKKDIIEVLEWKRLA